MIASCEDPKFSAIAAMLHEVQVRSRDFFYKNNIETTFDLKVKIFISTFRREGYSIKTENFFLFTIKILHHSLS